MSNTLGLTGDLDDVAMIMDVEAAFGLSLTDAETASCYTIGDIHALLMAHMAVSGWSGGACATAMCFYRLRKALQPLKPEISLKPSSELSVLKATPARDICDTIRTETGLIAPQPVKSGLATAAMAALIARTAAAAFLTGLSVWLALAILAAASVAWRFSPSFFPPQLETFGDLVRDVSARNAGLLAGQGARMGSEEIWEALCLVLANHGPLPRGEMRPDTQFLAA